MKASTLKQIAREFGIKLSKFDVVFTSVNTAGTAVLIGFGRAEYDRYNWMFEVTKKLASDESPAPYIINGPERIRTIQRNR